MMKKQRPCILVVEDENAHAEAISHRLQSDEKYSVQIVATLEDAQRAIVAQVPDLVLLDLNLPDGSAMELLDQSRPACPVLIMTAQGSEDLAVESLKAGALDYIVKSPESFDRMPLIVERSLREWRLQRDNDLAFAALKESELRFRTLLQDIKSVAVQGYHTDGTVFYWNKASEDLYGYQVHEVMGRNLLDLIIPESMKQDVRMVFSAMAAGEEIPAGEMTLRHKSGAPVEVYSSHAVVSRPGCAPELYCVDIDISERKHHELQLRKLGLAVEQSPSAVVITDLKGNIEYVNPKFTAVTGYSFDELVGKNPRILKSGKMDDAIYYQIWVHLLAGDEWQGELLNKHKQGHLFWERAQISPLRNDQGEVTHYIGVKEDITLQKEYEYQLEHMATHDELTGLANRAMFKNLLDRAVEQVKGMDRQVAVILLDLDRFKIINDTLGHAFGDDLLCLVAQRLKQVVRETDTVVRFGGDEFVVLLPAIRDSTAAARVASKILSALSKPYQLAGRDVVVTASLGLSMAPADGNDSTTLIRNADIAMYQSKSRRGEYSFYSDKMNLHMLENLELENDLRRALDNKELQLYYQPKIDLETGDICGCEALLRWLHPGRGMVSPGQFIPLAEETGMIVPIGNWVIEEACRQSLKWQAEGLAPIRIAVNLSARQFRQGDLVGVVSKLITSSGLPAELLELELTESMVMDNPHSVVQTLVNLKQLGVVLSLDDFGTGYSSLNYLRRFPVDSLKIDQSFIKDIFVDSSGASVVSSIIDIAHNLQLTAIAEGVETQEQLEFLIANGCDAVQGYLFSRPLPAAEFSEFLLGRAEKIRCD